MDIKTISKSLKLSKLYGDEREKLIKNAPYHLNIIDEVHANENSHSRILVRILQYKENDQYSNLISFLNYLDIAVSPSDPTINAEKDRIDATILDKDYAVIIENKIHNAVDQEEQLQRYVEVVEQRGYKLEQIYVLYLTRWGNKTPTLSSLPDDLRASLGSRYKEISFRFDVLPWLEEEVLPKCRLRDRELISGIEQYIDHLKGMFNLRERFNSMDTQLEILLKKELEFTDNVGGNDIILETRLNELNDCIDRLSSMRIDLRNNLRKEFLEKLFKRLNDGKNDWVCVNLIHEPITIEGANLQYFGFKNEQHRLLGANLSFSIQIQDWSRFLCGLCGENGDAELKAKQELQSKFSEKDIDMTFNNNHWVYLNLDSYEIKGNKPAHCMYDDQWNTLFAKDMDALVDMFYNNIIRVFDAWKAICEEAISDDFKVKKTVSM